MLSKFSIFKINLSTLTVTKIITMAFHKKCSTGTYPGSEKVSCPINIGSID